MQIITESVKEHNPETQTDQIILARFDKFLYINKNTNHITGYIDIINDDRGNLIAKLLTRTTSEKSSITRFIEHAAICFPKIKEDIEHLPFSDASQLKGDQFCIPSIKIYKELVPFGPCFQNIQNDLIVSQDGSIATIYVPMFENRSLLLGSSFTLDAAFHAACVWGQRFMQTVAFPVGFEKRIIINKSLPGYNYVARIVPQGNKSDHLFFDIWIYSDNGQLSEVTTGVKMRDVSGGNLLPPEWVKKG